jgi:hypothetical protein
MFTTRRQFEFNLGVVPKAGLVLLLATSAPAGVTHVTVGITPTCPYGITACWSGARAALRGLKGVRSVPETPDSYNCTADIEFSGSGLPDPKAWEQEFRKTVGELYVFRGVEVTVTGHVELKGEEMLLRSPGIERPVSLARFEHKLQYNFRKNKTRQAEPEEQSAYDLLVNRIKALGGGPHAVEIVGPVRQSGDNAVIEIREVYLLTP